MSSSSAAEDSDSARHVLFFGAGGAAEAYVRNTGQLPEIFVDNDSAKWGTEFCGVAVNPPSAITKFCQPVVVITSGYASEIRAQLEALGLAQWQIKTVAKRLLSSQVFKDAWVREQTIRAVANLQALQEWQAPIVLVGGGCLGLIRAGDLIPWDDDVDFRASLDDFDRILSHMQKLSSLREIQSSVNGARSSLVGEWTLFDGGRTPARVPFSLTFYDPTKTVLEDCFDRFVWKWPRDMFTKPSVVEIGKSQILVPNPPEDYLVSVYGSGWKMPQPDFSVDSYGRDA